MATATALLRSAVCDDSSFGRFVARIKQISKLFGEDCVAGIFLFESFADSATLQSAFRRRLATSIETRLLSPFAVLRLVLSDPQLRTHWEGISHVLQSGEHQQVEQLASLVYRPLANALRGCKLSSAAACGWLIEFTTRLSSQLQLVLTTDAASKADITKAQRRLVANALLGALDVLLSRFSAVMLVLHRAQITTTTGPLCSSLRAALSSVPSEKGARRDDDATALDRRAVERIEACLSALESRDVARLSARGKAAVSTLVPAPEPFGNDEVRLCFSTLLLAAVADGRSSTGEECVAQLAERVCVLVSAGRARCEEAIGGGLAFELLRTALLLVADASVAAADEAAEQSMRLAARLCTFVATRFGELLSAVLTRSDACETVAKGIEPLMRAEAHRALRESVVRSVGAPFMLRLLGSFLRAGLLRRDQLDSLSASFRSGESEPTRLSFVDDVAQFVDDDLTGVRTILTGAPCRLASSQQLMLVDFVRWPYRLLALRSLLQWRGELAPLVSDSLRFLAKASEGVLVGDAAVVCEFAYVLCAAVRDEDVDTWQAALGKAQLGGTDVEDVMLGERTGQKTEVVTRCCAALLDHAARSSDPLTLGQMLRFAGVPPLRTLSAALSALLMRFVDGDDAETHRRLDDFKVKSELPDESMDVLVAFDRVLDGLVASPSSVCTALCVRALLSAVYALRARAALRAAEQRAAARVIDGCVNRDGEQEDILVKAGADGAAPCDDIFGSALPNESALMQLARRESVSTTALRIFLDVTEKLPAAAAAQSQPSAAPVSDAGTDVKIEPPTADAEQKTESAPNGTTQSDLVEAERRAEKERRLVAIAQRLTTCGCFVRRTAQRELAALAGGCAEPADCESSAPLDALLITALSQVVASECGVFTFEAATRINDAADRRGTTWLVRTLFHTFLCTEERLATARQRRTCAALLAALVAVGCDAAALAELLRLTTAALQRCVVRGSHAFTDTNAEHLAGFLSMLLYSVYRLAPPQPTSDCLARFFDTVRQLVRDVAGGHVSVCHLFAKRLVHLLADYSLGANTSDQLLAQVPLELLGDLHVIAHYDLQLPLVLRLFDVRLRALDQNAQATRTHLKAELVDRTLSLIEHFRLAT